MLLTRLRATQTFRPATRAARGYFGARANSSAAGAGAGAAGGEGEGKRDPGHDHLYYHMMPASSSSSSSGAAPGSIALSFLPRRPVPNSRTVIGTLPAAAGAGLDDFRENPKFRALLQESIKDGLAKHVDKGLDYEAGMRPTDGYMTLTDERAVPPQGRIGETEDLIGSVFVKDGKIVPDTYEPFPSYRLVTPKGVCTLPRGLDAHVLKRLEKVDAEERGGK